MEEKKAVELRVSVRNTNLVFSPNYLLIVDWPANMDLTELLGRVEKSFCNSGICEEAYNAKQRTKGGEFTITLGMFEDRVEKARQAVKVSAAAISNKKKFLSVMAYCLGHFLGRQQERSLLETSQNRYGQGLY